MRRNAARSLVALVAVGGVLLVLRLATAASAPALLGAWPSHGEPPLAVAQPMGRQEASSGTSEETRGVTQASSSPAHAVAWGHSGEPLQQLSAPPRELASVSEQQAPPVTSLPPTTAEVGPDGLPVVALRCALDGGVVSCGECRTDSDCPARQGCVANRQTRRMECMASECEQDAHCFPGFLCRAVNLGSTGILVRRCTPEGQRRQGEPCDVVPKSPASSCGEGLVCVNEVCGIPCRLEDATGCPEGHVCTDSLNGPGCFPDCRARGCPEGQQCRHTGDSTHQCLVAAQGDCRDTPCPEGQHCNMRLSRGRAAFWCASLCNPLRADSCPPDQVCGMGSASVSTCFRRCDPKELGACGEGWVCGTVSEDMSLWGCRPSLNH
jgi:hypothetical protein